MAKTMIIVQLTLLFLITTTFGQDLKNLKINQNDVKDIKIFKNPILSASDSPSPNIYLHKISGIYYYPVVSEGNSAIDILQSADFTNLRNAEPTRVFNSSDFVSSGKIQDPNIQFIDEIFYIYFSMSVGHQDLTLRNYVMRAKKSYNPISEYFDPIELTPPGPGANTKSWSGQVLERLNGQLYFIYTGTMNDSSSSLNIFIAPMNDPTFISGPRVLLLSTEDRPYLSFLDSPRILRKNSRNFIIYSMKLEIEPDICLGIMGIDYQQHPLVRENWWNEGTVIGCSFWKNDLQNVFGPTRPTFTVSPDESESWMLYVASDALVNGQETVRAEPFAWNTDDFPIFPRPSGLEIEHAVPSGTK